RLLAKPFVDVLFAKPPTELFADAEQRQPQVQRTIRPPPQDLGRADDPVLTAAGRQVFLQPARRARRIARVKVREGLLDRRRLPLERPRRIPTATAQRED